MKKLIATAMIAALWAGAAPAQTLEPLSQEKYINDRLIAARVADRVRRECPSIDARMVKAWNEARALKRYAENKGYSAAQIDAFLDSRTEKDRIYGIAERYLTQNGARKGDAESFCRIGRAEIAGNSVAGSLLVAK